MTINNKLFANKLIMYFVRFLIFLNAFSGFVGIYLAILIIKYVSKSLFNYFNYKIPYDLPFWLFFIWAISFIVLLIPFIFLVEKAENLLQIWKESINLTNSILNDKIILQNESESNDVEVAVDNEVVEFMIGDRDSEEIKFEETIISKEEFQNSFLESNSNFSNNYLKLTSEDYINKIKKQQTIGAKGELFVLTYEKEALTKMGLIKLGSLVKHISIEEGDYYGYDILSYDGEGNEKYIEVKTSTKGYSSDFFLTENELNKIKQLNNYFIYRVFDFDIDKGIGSLYIVNCSKDFNDKFIIKPTQYKITPRKK